MKIRIDNLEFRKYNSTKRNKPLYEIIKWEENPYYNKEEEFRKNGYTDNFEGWGLKKDNRTIAKECFKNPENCFVIAFIEKEKEKEDWELRSVGERMLNLTPEEQITFYEIYKKGQEKLNKKDKKIYESDDK